MDLSTTYLGLRLPHPLMPGASPLADSLDTVKRLEDAGAAAIVLRSLFEEQIAPRPPRPLTLRRGQRVVGPVPELPEPRNNLAVIYAAQGNYPMARAELELALATAPDYAIARENLGDVYARMAAAQYERAAALDKTNRSAAQKLKLVRELFADSTPR